MKHTTENPHVLDPGKQGHQHQPTAPAPAKPVEAPQAQPKSPKADK